MTEPGSVTTVFENNRATKRRLKRSKLVVTQGPDAGKELVVEEKRVTVGRSSICNLVLEEDKAVSGTHFELVSTSQGAVLRDLGSTNGCFVGDLRISEIWATPGTVVTIGQSSIQFEPVTGTVEIPLSEANQFHELVGGSVQMREIFATLEKVGPSDLTVLIRGETGTGKELVARGIHRSSRRAEQPLVVLDCSAIPRSLIESTLFGHEKGAFTGATERHAGAFEQANGGTIFLDEIGELDVTLQPKLLRVLENREIKRVGGEQVVPINVRVVAATNRDLRKMVNDGTFREDLFYRLSVVQVELPPLRDRVDDIPLLIDTFLAELSTRVFAGDPSKQFSVGSDAMERLKGFPWPGNVRELKNTLERGTSLADGVELGLRDLMPSSQKTPPTTMPGGRSAEQFVDDQVPFKEAKQLVLDAFEAVYLKALLDTHGGNITRSAQAAGLTRYHLRELAKRYGIRDSD